MVRYRRIQAESDQLKVGSDHTPSTTRRPGCVRVGTRTRAPHHRRGLWRQGEGPVGADLLAALGGGLFAYSGAAPGEIAPVEDHSGATLLSNDDGVGAFYRLRGKRAPHNVYASTADLYAAGAEAGDHSAPPPALF